MITKFKKGDLITCKYKWGNIWKEGAGYLYEAAGLVAGLSCKDGGVTNINIKDLKDIKIVKQ